MVQHVQDVIDEHLEAIGQVYGRAYQARMAVTYTGGSRVVVKHPTHEHGVVMDIGMLELKTKYIRNQLQHRKLAA